MDTLPTVTVTVAQSDELIDVLRTVANVMQVAASEGVLDDCTVEQRRALLDLAFAEVTYDALVNQPDPMRREALVQDFGKLVYREAACA